MPGPAAVVLQRSSAVVTTDDRQQELRHYRQPDVPVEAVVIQQAGIDQSDAHAASCPLRTPEPRLPGCFSSDGKPQAFQHPVRLFWPKLKSFDYLYSDGEALLRNFPVQATISFYDESDSEDEDEEDWEEDGGSQECLKQHFTSYN